MEKSEQRLGLVSLFRLGEPASGQLGQLGGRRQEASRKPLIAVLYVASADGALLGEARWCVFTR